MLVVLAFVALIGWMTWAAQPAAGPHRRVAARVAEPATNPYSKWIRVPATMTVEFADGQRRNVTAPYTQLRECKVGDRIMVSSVPVNNGGEQWTIEPGTCG